MLHHAKVHRLEIQSINDNKMELHRENKNEVIAEKNKVEKHEINENSVEK